jgi:hypothetical protein
MIYLTSFVALVTAQPGEMVPELDLDDLSDPICGTGWWQEDDYWQPVPARADN